MKWTFTDDTPIYTQLVEQLKAGIVTGQYFPGERLPSVRELAGEAGVNPNTMQRALARLEEEGLVISRRTSGRFVTGDEFAIAATRRSLALRAIRDFRQSMARLGFRPEEISALLEQEFNQKGE